MFSHFAHNIPLLLDAVGQQLSFELFDPVE